MQVLLQVLQVLTVLLPLLQKPENPLLKPVSVQDDHLDATLNSYQISAWTQLIVFRLIGLILRYFEMNVNFYIFLKMLIIRHR